MKIEDQYPSPDRCKKLAKLGFPYDTCFFMRVSDKKIVYAPDGKTFYGLDYYPCPSVPEMLEMMPFRGKLEDDINDPTPFIIWKFEDRYSVPYYCCDFPFRSGYLKCDPNLANAVADCLIWLKEKNLISFQKKDEEN